MPASTSNALGSAAGLFSAAGSTSMGAPGGGGVGGGIAASSSLSLNSLELDASNGHMGPSGVATSSAAANPNGMTATNASGLDENSRTMALALELALLQGNPNGIEGGHHHQQHNHHHHQSHAATAGGGGSSNGHPQLQHANSANFPMGHHESSCGGGGGVGGSGLNLLNGFGNSGSLEDLKVGRRSQNMTECVPVPTSEHVAEIVGRQGCKIKALRAKTNTYIKTPVRGEEPVFVVTGRKEDVALAKREILSAADHFSQIRASRTKNSINSTLAFGQLVANQPGQTTVQVRVPYRVVGLVVGPKGATIKRIQQQTHTYIVTPSRDKEPVFEVTGLPENVDAARKEIEAHIALRTGETGTGCGSGCMGNNSSGSIGASLYGNMGGDSYGCSSSSATDEAFGGGGNFDNTNKFSSILNGHGGGGTGLDSAFSSLTSNSSGKGITLQNILDSNNFGDLTASSNSNHSHSSSNSSSGIGSLGLRHGAAAMGSGGSAGHHQHHSSHHQQQQQHHQPWSNGTNSHDSGVGHSPPFEHNGHHALESSLSAGAALGGGSGGAGGGFTGVRDNGTAIWGDLSKALGGIDLGGGGSNSLGGHHQQPQQQHVDMSSGMTNGHLSSHRSEVVNQRSAFMCVGSRASLDLGTLGRISSTSSNASSSSSSASNTATTTPPSGGVNALLMSSNSPTPNAAGAAASNGVGGPAALQTFGGLHRASVSSEPASYSAVAAAEATAEATASTIANEVAIEAFSDSSDNSAKPPQQQQGSRE